MDIGVDFNPRTPRGVRPDAGGADTVYVWRFQSTHPARGATQHNSDLADHFGISIHAPREGCDAEKISNITKPTNFNPRTPRGVRQSFCSVLRPKKPISIHAPREGCDNRLLTDICKDGDFNPRTPRGVRHWTAWDGPPEEGFQSTHPARGATNEFPERLRRLRISIHAPREGCDKGTSGTNRWIADFNPRTPRGVRPVAEVYVSGQFNKFQSTHPARGATGWGHYGESWGIKFQSTHPARGATGR